MTALQVRGEILDVRKAGAYAVITTTAPGIPEQVVPGHFVSIATGSPDTGLVLRRVFSIHGAQTRGVFGGTIDIVVSPHGPGTQWLAGRSKRDIIDVVGPLGKPFSLPRQPVGCILVGGGYGSAPLFMLADQLRQRGSRVDMVLGAARAERIFGHIDGKRAAASLTVTTEDGSLGETGRVTDVLPGVIERTKATVVYACGPMGMLKAVHEMASARGLHVQVSVEEHMACGFGVCMTCVLPVIGDDGVTRMVRSCVEGPAFHGHRVRWDALGTVPDDALGAPHPAPVRPTT